MTYKNTVFENLPDEILQPFRNKWFYFKDVTNGIGRYTSPETEFTLYVDFQVAIGTIPAILNISDVNGDEFVLTDEIDYEYKV